jgi:hypothetical protein
MNGAPREEQMERRREQAWEGQTHRYDRRRRVGHRALLLHPQPPTLTPLTLPQRAASQLSLPKGTQPHVI